MGKSGNDNKVCFNHLIRECVLAGEWDKASEAITRMVHQGRGGTGVRFDHNTFNAVSEVSLGMHVLACLAALWLFCNAPRPPVRQLWGCDAGVAGRLGMEEGFFCRGKRLAPSVPLLCVCVCGGVQCFLRLCLLPWGISCLASFVSYNT